MNKSYADHSWFEFRPQSVHSTLNSEGRGLVNIHLIIHVQAFHIDAKPDFMVLGMLDRPYPDVTSWSQRKVGVRDGLARICRYLDQKGLSASFVVEADAVEELEALMPTLTQSRHSIIAGGQHAALLQSEFSTLEAEIKYIEQVMSKLRGHFDNLVDAWRSPFGVQSPNTLVALAKGGVRYTLDFNNDDFPYPVQTEGGPLTCLPYQHFSSDLHCIQTAKQLPADYLEDLTAGLDWLHSEALTKGPQLLTLPLYPWVIGVPHRFNLLKSTLEQWSSHQNVHFISAKDLC